MTAMTLPLIEPTLHGMAEGIIQMDPLVIQCRQCGYKDDAETVGMPKTGHLKPALVFVLSQICHHSRPWTSGHTDNPRLCRACRLSRGCTCVQCADERRCYGA